MSRRRVFHLIKGLGRGGAEVLLEQALRFGDARRFEYAFGYFLPWKDAMVDPLRRLGAEVVCFEARGDLAILRSVGRVTEHLRRWRADLLHCHLPLSGVVGCRAGRRSGTRAVLIWHPVFECGPCLPLGSNLTVEEVEPVADAVAASITGYGRRCTDEVRVALRASRLHRPGREGHEMGGEG